MKIGIIGLPNVGKTSLLNALTQAGARCGNFPFTTIEPNTAYASINDSVLDKIALIFNSRTTQYASIRFTDIAGLIKGASQGEGLGNQFLSHIRSCDALLEVVRLFDDKNVVNTQDSINPVRDIEIIQNELILSDIEQITRLKRDQQDPKILQKAPKNFADLLKQAQHHLNKGIPLNQDATLKDTFKSLDFLTAKPILYIANTNSATKPEQIKQVLDWAESNDQKVLVINLEAQLLLESLDLTEQEECRREFKLNTVLDQIIKESFKLLDLITFYTANANQASAWPIAQGATAYQAAGIVHTDFQKGFIRAQVCQSEDLLKLGSINEVKQAGLLRIVGKDYLINQADVIEFLFHH